MIWRVILIWLMGNGLTHANLPRGLAIVNAYDTLARLTNTALVNPWGHVLDGYGYGLDPLGLRTNMVRELGLTTNKVSIGYDPIGQLTNWSGAEANLALRHNEQLAYSYDSAGNLQMRTNDALVQTFVVDSLNQLSNVTRSGQFTVTGATPVPAASLTVNGVTPQTNGDFTFASTSNTLVNGANTFTIIGQNAYGLGATNVLTLTLSNSVNFQYDANGNLTNDGTRVFSYDAENQLTNIAVAGQWRTGFVFDGLRRKRIERDYTWLSGWVPTNEIHYIYDGTLVVQEQDTNNHPLATYTRGLDLSLTLKGAGGISGLLARTDTNGSAYYHADGSGNITSLVESYGNIVARYEYDAFGRTLNKQGTYADLNRYGYSSKEKVSPANIYYFGFRFYDPIPQRFLNRDLIGEAGGINLYRFVGNSPANLVDAYGLTVYYSPYPFAPNQEGTYEPYAQDVNDGNNALINAEGVDPEFFGGGGLQGTDLDFLPLFLPEIPAVGKALDAAADALGNAAKDAFDKMGLRKPKPPIKCPIAAKPSAAQAAVSPAVRNAMYNGGIESVPQAERDAAAAYYDQMAQTAKGDAAQALNAARANYARYGRTPPSGIGNFQ